MTTLLKTICFASCMALTCPLYANNIEIIKVSEAQVTIDGQADEAFWAQVPVLTGFIQYEPNVQAPSSRATEVKIAYSINYLYVLARMSEPDPSKIVRLLTRRDRENSADHFAIDIDSYYDHRNGYHFRINAAGTVMDGTLTNDAPSVNTSWDAVWKGAVSIQDDGWIAEMAIPFSCLRFRGGSEHKIGINLRRFIGYNRESVSLIDMAPAQAGYVSRFVTLEGITGINTGQTLVPVPYFSLRNPGKKPLGKNTFEDLAYGLGLDLAYGWANGTILNATFNPDFGQVEADRDLIDLSGFETFFPEKRPFFLEGAPIFASRYDLFYSRRIGRQPTRAAEIPAGGALVEKPNSTTILGAAKFTGKTDSGLQFGVIEALTGREDAIVADSMENELRSEVEPRALYQVARVKQDILANSWVGLMATGRHYDGNSHAANLGADWNVQTPPPDYRCNGQVVTSRNDLNVWGYGGKLTVSKDAGKYLTGNICGHYESPDLDLNPTGYFTKPGQKGVTATINGALRPGTAGIRKLSLNTAITRTWNINDVSVENGIDITQGGTFDWFSYSLGYNRDFAVYDDHSSRYGHLIGIKPTQEIWTWITPELGTQVDLTVKLEYRPVWIGQSWRRVGFTAAVRPLPRWEVSLDTKLSLIKDPQRWVASACDTAGNGVDITSRMDQRTLDIVSRSTFLFTNHLSLQLYNQLFTGITRYTGLRRLVDPFNTTGLGGVVYTADPDFGKTVCNTNLTLRWEFKAGSTFYLVWSQGYSRETEPSDQDLFSGLKLITARSLQHSFLMKFDYRFTLNIK